MLVRAFYAFLLYTAVGTFTTLPLLLDHTVTVPLWPVAWLRDADPATGPRVLMAFYLATNILGVFTAAWRTGRALTFLGLLEYVALKNSFGKIGHSLHLLLLVAGVFLLLPAGWERPAPQTGRRRRQETLLVFWLAQAAVLTSYTMSGVAKVGVACLAASPTASPTPSLPALSVPSSPNASSKPIPPVSSAPGSSTTPT